MAKSTTPAMWQCCTSIKLRALLDCRIEQSEREGRSEPTSPRRRSPGRSGRQTRSYTTGGPVLPDLEKAIENAKRPTEVGRFILTAIVFYFSTGKSSAGIDSEVLRAHLREPKSLQFLGPRFRPAEEARKWLEEFGDIECLVLVAKSNGQPIDNDLFETIGRELGVGGSTKVKDLYSLLRDVKTPR